MIGKEKLEMLALELEYGEEANIWYDAFDAGDYGKDKLIDQTRSAMKKTSRLLKELAKIEIDWGLLREQKLWLLGQQNSKSDGLLHLIDAVQDFAAEEIGEEKVFGRRKHGRETAGEFRTFGSVEVKDGE